MVLFEFPFSKSIRRWWDTNNLIFTKFPFQLHLLATHFVSDSCRWRVKTSSLWAVEGMKACVERIFQFESILLTRWMTPQFSPPHRLDAPIPVAATTLANDARYSNY